MARYIQILFFTLGVLFSCEKNENKTSINLNENSADIELSSQFLKNKNSEEKLYFAIDFQDFFDNDMVTLIIDDCTIFKNAILTSDKIDGMTDVSLKVTSQNSMFIITLNNQKEVRCENEGDFLLLTIVVNEVENTFQIDLNNGKYVGFDKTTTNELRLHQSQIQFEYD